MNSLCDQTENAVVNLLISVTVPQLPSLLLERIAAANVPAYHEFQPAPKPIPAAIAVPIPGRNADIPPLEPATNAQLRDNSSSFVADYSELVL